MTDLVVGLGVPPPLELKVTVYCLGALQLAVVAGALLQVQVKLEVLVVTVLEVPMVQRLVDGAVSVATPFAVPQEGF